MLMNNTPRVELGMQIVMEGDTRNGYIRMVLS